MPELTQKLIKDKIKFMNEARDLKKSELLKWLFYSGATKVQISDSIRKEFKDPDTINELEHRILPYNFMKKIINRLSAVYVEQPERLASNESETDTELLEQYERSMLLNVRMKEVNRHFKLFKKSLGEIYVDEDGIPRFRVLPPHTYFVFSHSAISPEKPDMVVKILNYDIDQDKQEYAFYTNDNFVIVDGKGAVNMEAMVALENPEGVNPLGVLPFAYAVDSSTQVEPIPDDDILQICKSIPVFLTDLAFASKYQAYSLVWTVDFEGDIPSGPNAVLHLNSKEGDKNPSVNQLKPTVDIDATLRMIEADLALLLSSRNLQTDVISSKMTVGNAASGISKAIDSVQLNEEQKIDQAYMADFEEQVWSKLSKEIIPSWRQGNKLSAEFNREFAADFSAVIKLREPKTTLTEMEQIEISTKKLEASPPLSTLKRELSALNPEFTAQEIDTLYNDIIKEAEKKVSFKMEALVGESNESQIQDQSDRGVQEDVS